MPFYNLPLIIDIYRSSHFYKKSLLISLWNVKMLYICVTKANNNENQN